jgi:SecD/SecF fusion protein
MRPFLWRIVICLAPVLLAGYEVAVAFDRYEHGQGGFRLGVDLVGGTILTYEIDKEKTAAAGQGADVGTDKLAEALKRRIDPADLLNVTIRPVGAERVEIVLPTGSTRQAEAERAAWAELINKVRQDPEFAGQLEGVELDAPRGQTHDLAVLIKSTLDGRSWRQALADVEKKYPALKGKFDKVDPGAVAAAVEQAKKVPGIDPEAVRKDLNELYREKSLTEVETVVKKYQPDIKQRRDASAEQVQEIKDKISQAGRLEFSILAIDYQDDDSQAVRAAQDYFLEAAKNEDRKRELQRLAEAGSPPPAPVGDFTVRGDPARYRWVDLGRGERLQLGLSNAASKEALPNSRWLKVAQARDRGEAWVDDIIHYDTQGQPIPATRMLVYSRACVNARLSAADRDEKKYEYFVLIRDSDKVAVGVDGVSLSANADTDPKTLTPAVGFNFNSVGGQKFYEITSRNGPSDDKAGPKHHRMLAIILDNEVVSAPSLNEPISNRGIITGHFTQTDVNRLVAILRSGALPATLKSLPVSESTIGPTLGEDTIQKGRTAVGLSFIVVLVFMVFYYRFAGLVACVALLANLVLTVGFMVAVNATFTLPGLAGLVLMLGMAVDANVLIYERLREERDKGASLALAIRNGYDRAFPTIIDTHLTSIFTAIVLYAFGNDQLKGFGVSLTAGLIISLFTSLVMTRLMFDIWLARGWLRKLSMLRMFSRPNIDFMRIRYYWFTATAILTIFGISIFLFRWKSSLNIDFNGGTSYTGHLTQQKTTAELRDLLAPERQVQQMNVASVQQSGDDERLYQVTYADGSPTVPVVLANTPPGQNREQREQNIKARASVLPDYSVEQLFLASETAGPNNSSSHFTVRTTEMERNLVLLSVSRLFRDGGTDLLQHGKMAEPTKTGNLLRFTFDRPASPGYVASLLEESLRGAGIQGVPVPLHGVGKADEEGNYQAMELDVSPSQQLVALDPSRWQTVLAQTRTAFESRPAPLRLENFDATLAKETQAKALWAIIASWAAILIYLWFRFGSWTFGAAAVVCLIHDLCFTLGIIAFCHYITVWFPGLASLLLLEDFKIDLQTVAALLTLVGYSVNDTIVVFDRIREVRGKNPALTPQMINDAVNQTLSRTLLAASTVFLVVIVLYLFGGEGVHLFSFVMVVGVVIGTYSSIYVASPLLLIFGEGKPPVSVRGRSQPAPASV